MTSTPDPSTSKRQETRAVIFDTGALHADAFLQGARLLLLCGSSEDLGIRVCVPQVVLDELRDQYRRDVQSNVTKLTQVNLTLERLQVPHKGALTLGTEVQVSTSLKRLDKHLAMHLTKHRINVLPYPTTPHRELAERAMRGARPFQHDGRSRDRGYRDALIWECVKDVIRGTNTPVTFVSPNSNDFGQQGRLHEDLIRDIQSSSLDSSRVELISDLAALCDKYVLPHLDSITDLLPQINTGHYHIVRLQELIDAEVQASFRGRVIDGDDDCESILKTQVTVSRVQIGTFWATQAQRIGNGEVLLKGAMTFSADVEPVEPNPKTSENLDKLTGRLKFDAVLSEPTGKLSQVTIGFELDSVAGPNWSTRRFPRLKLDNLASQFLTSE